MVKIFQVLLPMATVVDQVVPQGLRKPDKNMHAMHELIEQENLKNYCKSITSCKRVLIALEKMQTLGAKIATHRNLNSEQDLEEQYDRTDQKLERRKLRQQQVEQQNNLPDRTQSLKYHPATQKIQQHQHRNHHNQIAIETMAELQLDRFSNHDLDSFIDYESKLSRKHNQTEGISSLDLESYHRSIYVLGKKDEEEEEELEPLVPLLPDENTVIKVDILQESYGSLLW